MTDIVERLRTAYVTDGWDVKVVVEAADEIEKLRADADHHLRAYQIMFNDNERLRAALQDIARMPLTAGAAGVARRALEPKP